jgi:hypothetical protein
MKDQLEKAKEKGFSVQEVAEKIGVMYLLSCKMEEINSELCDYLKEYSMVNSFRNDIYALNRDFKSFREGVVRLIDEKGKENLFKEYDKLSELIDNHIKENK